jgi:predicted Zn-dependent protease
MKNKLFQKIIFSLISIYLVLAISGCKKKKDDEMSEAQKSTLQRELEFGRLVTAELINQFGPYNKQEVAKYLNLLGKGLAMYVGRPEINYHFAIVKTDKILSFAAPGGYIVISRGLMKASESEAELASVLAHEIYHVNQKDLLNMADNESHKTLELELSETEKLDKNQQAIGYGRLLLKAMAILTDKGLTKENELKADEFALTSIHSIGYDAMGMIHLLKAMEKTEKKMGKANVFPGKPAVKERLANVEKILKENKIHGGEKALPRFQLIKKQIN